MEHDTVSTTAMTVTNRHQYHHNTNEITTDPLSEQCRQSSSFEVSSLVGSDYYSQNNIHLEDEKEVIAIQETKIVLRLKFVVFLVLVCSSTGVATAVYCYSASMEDTHFRDQFDNDARKVVEAFGRSLEKTLGAFDSLAVTMVSTARLANETWPFVTLPDFALRASKIVPPSDAVVVSIMPLVTPETRVQYEDYTLAHDGWVDESMAIQETWDGYYGPVLYDWEPSAAIHSDHGVLPYHNTNRTVLLPIWQSFPVVPRWAPYGWDWLTQYSPGAPLSCLRTHRTTISEAYMLPNPDNPEKHAESVAWADWFKDFIAPDEEPMEPVSDIFYPIIDQLDRVTVVDGNEEEYDPDGHALVGVIAVDVYWRNVIKNILSPGSMGIVIVFENPCNEAFTYQIDGPTPTFLGVGDLHSNDYDSLGVHRNLTDLCAARTSGYSGSPLDVDFCPFTLHVYPSITYEGEFTTKSPLIFTIVAAAIFLFVSLIFILYDYSVSRRQRVVMNRAVASSAIVSSLYPSQVRDQIYEENKDLNPLNSLLPKDWMIATTEDTLCCKSRPIAQAYPNTTILFADLAGFTKWSRSRTPVDVFELLESLYYAFDTLAHRRSVFKVETIGDCYLACTGCPRPQEFHACIMVKFARDIMTKTKILVKELATTLGEETAQLEMRVGLHSGEVHGGVLRGQKGRFQLYGDSVNTASRMESNGVRGRIHASQATADALIAKGKGHWLTPREDKIVAKGLGEMQTYWVNDLNGGFAVNYKSDAAGHAPRTISEKHVQGTFPSPIAALAEGEEIGEVGTERGEQGKDELGDRYGEDWC